MPAFAPRIPQRLHDAIVRLDDPELPIAETCRRVGAEAERLGLPRPSYQRVRVLVHASRQSRRRAGTVSVLVALAVGVRPPAAVLDHVFRLRVPGLDGRRRR